MPHFILIGLDGPDGLQRRPAARPAHLEHWAKISAAGRLVFAGPLLKDGNPIGSLIIFEAASPEEARAMADADPYVAAEVFGSTELHPTQQVLP